MKKLKIAFFGTGDFSKNILSDLLKDSRVEVKLVVSQLDKPVGRKKILEKTPVKLLSEENSIEVLQPEKLRTSPQPSSPGHHLLSFQDNSPCPKGEGVNFLDYLDSLELDFILVVAYGKIVPKRVLESAKYGCINLHGSILPKYRGASPIQEAVKNGDKKTGLTVMFMSKGMDEGDILKIKEIDIDKDDKTQDVFDKFEEFGAKLAVDTLEEIVEGKIKSIPQNNEEATYCSKITKEDGEIDFSKNTSQDIYNKFRAYSNWPGIYCFYKDVKLNIEDCEIFNKSVEMSIYGISNNINDINLNNQDAINGHLYIPGKVIKINKKTIGIVCSNKKILILKQVKLAGKKSMDIISFINGNKDFLDYKF